ncbi:unnamed protein product [Ectocarpus sp. 6 AP-2014]
MLGSKKKREKEWLDLPEPERTTQLDWGKGQVEAWKAGKEKKAACMECSKGTWYSDNPILLCDGCVRGALHLRCTKFPLEAIPGEEDEWFCDACRERERETPPVQPTVADGPGSTQPQPQPMNVDGPGSTQPQPQPMNVDGPGSTQPQPQPGGVGGPMERAPVSTVANPITATKRKPRAASKGKAKAGKTKAGSTAGNVRKRRVRKPARVVAKEYARILEDVLNSDEMGTFVEASRAKAAEKAKHFENTCPRTPNEPPSSITSIPLIAKLLTRGLCDDPLDGIEILDGVFFKRAALDALERYFNWEYVFDPESIGVFLGTTKVGIDDEEFVVESFDCGEYSLSDGSVMQQWGVLENRTDGGVTLEDEQRRFIIHLVTTYVNMMAHVVPVVIEESTPSMVKDMMWNPVEAGKRETNKERREELDQIINRVNTLRDLTLRIFTGAAVKDTLPASFWDVEGNEELREFAEEAGSLKKINFLGRLECVHNREVVAGKLFTGEIVTGGYSEAPKPDRVSGAWPAKLRSIIVQLTCAYRLGRSNNLLEAYYALSEAEIELVMKGHRSHWGVNLDYGLPHLDRLTWAQTTATDADLQGENSHALRFAVKRCRVFNPNIAPVTVVGCGIRDAEKYGSLQRDSLDSKYFSHARIGKKLVPPLMGNASCREPAKQAVEASGKLFDVARNGRAKATAEKSGAVGPAAKVRKQRVILLELTPEEREKAMDMFMAAITKNGCGRLMDAIKKHDPGFVEWGKECLAKADLKSSVYTSRDNYLETPDDGRSEDHLLGNTSAEIQRGQQRVARLMTKLDAENGFKPKDISVFSVALALACLFAGACLRPQDFFRMVASQMYYDAKLKRIKIRLLDGKQTEKAEKTPSRVCMYHELEGAEVVDWWVVMALVGRPFLKKHNQGFLDKSFGPLGTDGEVLTEYVFGVVLESIGKAFFSTGNADVNALRSVQESLAAEHMVELGIPKDSVIKGELSKQMRTSNEALDDAYDLRTADPVHVVRRNCNTEKYSCKGGIRGMLISRRLALEGVSETSSSACDTDADSGGGDFGGEVDAVMAGVDREIEMERKIKLLRQLKTENASCGGGATPATVAPAPTGAAHLAAAGAEEKPKKIKRGQIPGQSVKYEPKPGRPIKDKERDGLKEVVEEIKGAWERAKKRQSAKSKEHKVDPVYHYMSLPSNRNAKLPMVWTLQEIDADEFQPGDWFRRLRCSQRNRSQTTFNKTVDRAEAQVTGFTWLSWQQVDG